MKKFILDLTVTENIEIECKLCIAKIDLSVIIARNVTQRFAELRVDGSPTTFLRRPISINFVDKQRNEVWF